MAKKKMGVKDLPGITVYFRGNETPRVFPVRDGFIPTISYQGGFAVVWNPGNGITYAFPMSEILEITNECSNSAWNLIDKR